MKAASSPSLFERSLRFVAWALLALAMSPSRSPADQHSVLLVPGVEYTTPIHFCVAGIPRSLDSFAYQSGPVPPYAAVAADLRSFGVLGRPLTWYSHPNWRPSERPPAVQLEDLLGIQAASGGGWYPEAIGFLNVGIDPATGGPPATWRKQLAIELANLYCPLVAPDSLPAFLLEVDFHLPPSNYFNVCGGPATQVWVPANWRSLPPVAAKDSLFAAIRARQVIGVVGAAGFQSLESDDTSMSLELAAPIRHLELWGGGAQPVATWSNTATASISYAQLTGNEPYLYWFAYGDTLAGGPGGWNTWGCVDKEVFFTSPMPRTGPRSFANPYSAAARAGRIPVKILVHQHTSLSSDAPQGPSFATLSDECRALGIDCILTTDHDPTLLAPLPSCVAAWDSIPASPPQMITNTGSGRWSSTVPDAPWPQGAVPTFTDDVTIADGTTVLIDTAAACRHLSVGRGSSGILEFEGVAPHTLGVGGDLTIASGGTLRTALNGMGTGHELRVTGNVVNHGTLDLSTAGGAAGCGLVAVGSASATLTGDGAVTDLYTLTVHKGVSNLPVFTLAPTSFTIRGSTNDQSGFVTLLSGTLRIAGSFSCSTRLLSGTASYVIGTTAGLWLDNPNFQVTPADGSPRNAGLLRISQGLFRVGVRAGNVLSANSGSVFDIQGGVLEVAGRLATTTATSYRQSGGIVRVAVVGNTDINGGSFDLSSTGSSFTMSGGSIVLVHPSSSLAPLDYRVASQTLSLTGGAVEVGEQELLPGASFRIAGALPNLIVRNCGGGGGNGAMARIHSATPPTRVFLDTTIEHDAVLDLRGFALNQLGPMFTNDGIVIGMASGSRLVFSGSVPQTLRGTGTIMAPLADLTIDNPGGLELADLAMNIRVIRVRLTRGQVRGSRFLTIGHFGGAAATTEIGGPGVFLGGSFDEPPVFNLGSCTYVVDYRSESTPRTTGFEIPPGGAVDALTIDNQSGVTVAGGAITVASSLLLTNGVLYTNDDNPVILARTVAQPPAGSVTSYVDGPLKIERSTVAPTDVLFAIGRGGAFRPLVLRHLMTEGVPRTFGAELLAVAGGGTPEPPLVMICGFRRFRFTGSEYLDPGARIELRFGLGDGVTTVGAARVAQAMAVDGAYASRGGTATGVPGAGTVVSTLPLVSGATFFAVGLRGDLPQMSIGNASVTESANGPAMAELTVGLSTPIDAPVSALCQTADGTATAAGGDYLAIAPPETLRFDPGGPLTRLVSVAVLDDTIPEPNESFLVELSAVINAGLEDDSGEVTIIDNDEPGVWIGDANLAEGDSASADARFSVYLSTAVDSAVTVPWRTRDGTATGQGNDYGSAADILVFVPGGPLVREIDVSVIGDRIKELDETFSLELSGVSGAVVLDSVGTATIVNDDPLPRLTINDVSVAEGDSGTTLAVFHVALSGASQPPVSVLWETADGTALAAAGDYVAVAPPRALVFNLGDSLVAELQVTVQGDLLPESDEDFSVLLSAPQNAAIARGAGVGVILNDDGVVLDAPETAPPLATHLGTAYPNPVRERALIPVGIAAPGRVELDVFDVNGRFVRTLVRSTLGAGERRVVWDGRDCRGLQVSSGMYVLRLSAGGRTWTSRLMVIR